MNKFKKIGLSALAGSLVAVTAHAGEMSVNGNASVALEHVNGGADSNGKSWSMGNQLTFSGSGELDNGMNISLSFVLDQGDDETDTATQSGNSPFDSHSVTVSMDGLGAMTFHGEGGDSAVGAMDGSAAGGIWDNFMAAADEPESGHSSNDMITYAAPELLDGLAINASYTPAGDGGADSSTSYALTYTGFDKLTLAYGVGEDNQATATADATAWKVEYTFGPLTATVTELEYDHDTDGSDRDMESQAISYLLPGEEISISYGQEELTDGTGAEDAEFESLSASYTTGGMTLTVAMQDGTNVDYSTTETEDQERWAIGASFAF
jgi:outer membrane protein OmpU